MHVVKVNLENFRNYAKTELDLGKGKTVLIGRNAQGKSNFLEAIEMASTGKSQRAASDAELVYWGKSHLSLEVVFIRQGAEQSVALDITMGRARGKSGPRWERQVRVNGVSHATTRALSGRLVTVSFSSQDLNLIRGGPKFRREWIDLVISRLKPSFQDTLANYQKVVAQRNRLLKAVFERKKLTVSDNDQLVAWDTQLGRYGATIIKQRLKLIDDLLPVAHGYQSHLSGHDEALAAEYLFRAPERQEDDEGHSHNPVLTHPVESLAKAPEAEIAEHLKKLLKERRAEEIGRKQTLIGPHRDDIDFSLNGQSAGAFGSQGQQRSLVLSMKLAELALVTTSLGEPPVLLLDDVLAELDPVRQGLLMSAVAPDMQTVITTTHLTSFDPSWLAGARAVEVRQGEIVALPDYPYCPAGT